MSNGFLLDLNRCTGCDACRLACTIENGLEPDVSWRDVYTFNDPRHPALPVYHLSLACHHCADAPCADACPAVAISRDPLTGAVLIDADRCIGCGYCSWACPFDAPRYDDRAGVMTKCTFCNPRLTLGEAPACVAACPTRALDCGDIETGGGVEHVPGFPRTNVGPAVRFAPLDRPGPRPASTFSAHAGSDASCGPVATKARSKIRLATEWPLLLFTLVAAGLVGWMGSRVLAPVRADPLVFLAIALAGVAASTLHLGRKLRAYRAVLNFRGSWLSREVVFYSSFVAVSILTIVLAPGSRSAQWLALLLGLACLYSVDRVYDVARSPGSARPHSADAVLTGVFLAAVIAASPLLATFTGAVKTVLYAAGKAGAAKEGNDVRPWVGTARIGLGIVAPALMALVDVSTWHEWVLGCVALGEIIDRCEYYADLRVPTPRRQVGSDLRALLAATGPGGL